MYEKIYKFMGKIWIREKCCSVAYDSAMDGSNV